jgi:hypothetical protein
MNAADPIVGGWQKRLGICLWEILPLDEAMPDILKDATSFLAATSQMWNVEECIFG